MKKLYFRLREALFINRLSHRIPGMIKPFILCYHQINVEEFDMQLTRLKSEFEIVDLETFVARMKQKKTGAFCSITLDDCLTEDIAKAADVCRKHNLPITFFLPVRFSITNKALPGTWLQKILEKRTEFVLNGEDIRVTSKNRIKVKNRLDQVFPASKFKTGDLEKLVQNFFAVNNLKQEDIITNEFKVIPTHTVQQLASEKLFNFQSHTYNHESLGLCTREEIQVEFYESKKVLEDLTCNGVFAICYPYGSKEIVGNKVFENVSDYYSCGLSLVQGVCTSKTDIFFMPRIAIYPGDKLVAFWGKIYHYMFSAFLGRFK